jgi:hypothetical protein
MSLERVSENVLLKKLARGVHQYASVSIDKPVDQFDPSVLLDVLNHVAHDHKVEVGDLLVEDVALLDGVVDPIGKRRSDWKRVDPFDSNVPTRRGVSPSDEIQGLTDQESPFAVAVPDVDHRFWLQANNVLEHRGRCPMCAVWHRQTVPAVTLIAVEKAHSSSPGERDSASAFERLAACRSPLFV